MTLRQDFGVSAQSNAAKRRSLFQPNQNRCRATLAAVDGGIIILKLAEAILVGVRER